MNYEKVEQALELLFDSDVSFVLSYRTEGDTCKVVRCAGDDSLFICTTGVMTSFANARVKAGYSLSYIAREIELMATQANKVACDKAKKIKEVQ